MRWQATVVGVIGAAALVTSACGHIATATDQHSYSIGDRVNRLVIQDDAGNITVTVGDGPISVTEKLRYSSKRPKTTRTVSDGTLTLADNGCGGHWGHCEVAYTVRVPASTAVDIQTDAGAVTVTGLAGDLHVKTDAGLVRATKLTSQHTSVSADAATITLAYLTAPSTVDVRTDAGTIDVRVPGGDPYAVKTESDSGKITVSVPTDAGSARTITAHTDAGPIQIRTV